MKKLFFVFIFYVISANFAYAQNTGGVFPPGFGDDHQSAQYRITLNTDNDRFNQRAHFQKSIDSKRLWRVVVQTRETDSSDFDFDFIQAELFWEFSDSSDSYRSGIRFDARLRDDNRAGQAGVNWAHQWKFDDGWRARLIALSALQIGDNKVDGISLSPRAQIAKTLESGPTLGVEYFGSFGNTEDITFGKARQTIGPFISSKIASKTTIMGGAQFGFTDVSPDAELRLWLTQNF